MHLRVAVTCGRVWAGRSSSRSGIQTHTHTHTHMRTHLTICTWRGQWGGREVRNASPHTTTHHSRALTTSAPPPPPHTTNNNSQEDTGSQRKNPAENPHLGANIETFTPFQHAPREELGPMGFFGVGRGLRNSLASREEKKPEDWNDILNRWYIQYQDFIGITDLKKAQDRVTELSDGLLEAQGERRRLQAEMESLQGQLVDNHQQITKTEQYSQEHMQLFSEARVLNEQLRQVRAEFMDYERRERETFTHLSAAIRDCHERERMQAEQSKYWSIIASVVSAALASVITSVNNWVRIKEIKEHITTSHETLLDGYKRMQADILASLDSPPSATHRRTPAAPTPENVEKITQEFKVFSTDMKQNLTSFADDVVSRLQSTLTAITGREPTPVRPLQSAGVTGPPAVASGGEVSYARVVAAMVVGASLGTLVTAFFLGALGGSAG